jgi:hypothetical protein
MPMGELDHYHHHTVVDGSLLDNCCTPVAPEGRCNRVVVVDRKVALSHVATFDSHHNGTTVEKHPFDTPWFLPVEVNPRQSFPN